MRSIQKYFLEKQESEEDICCFKHKKEDLLYEDFGIIFTQALIFGAIYFTWYIVLLLISILFMKPMLRKAKEIPEYSKHLSDLVDKEIKCHLITNKTPNAFNAGGSSCYMTSSLYNMLTKEERIAIFIHEYGHYEEKHLIKIQATELTVGVLSTVVLSFLTLTFIGFVPIIWVLLTMFINKGIVNALSRSQEFKADEYALKYGYEKHLQTGLRKIEEWVRKKMCSKLSKEKCDELLEQLYKNSTHPGFKERYRKLLLNNKIQKFIFVNAVENQNKDNINMYDKIKNYILQFFRKEVTDDT